MGDVLPPGTRLGRYEIVQRLALGGMAEIYLARMSGLAGFAKHVVLKRILPSHARDAEFVRMFFNEARYAATLDHPNIAHVYDLGEEQGLHYFTMEYLHGEDCRTLLRELATRGLAFPLEHALTIVVGAAAGCHFAHELAGDDGAPLGLIHRDVSPSNVVVTYAGAVKLVDFGIAKATKLEDVTAIGVTKGKLAYMAPEQCRGEALDRRVDIYALGVLLYELTTQRRAFAGQNDANVMWAVISGDVLAPRSVDPAFPPALEQIIQRAMHVDRTQRPATARELAQAIEAFARDAGLTLNPAALGEFLERTMGPKLEPWKSADRGEGKVGRASASPPALAAPLPGGHGGHGADAPTYAPTPLPRLDSGTDPATPTSGAREAETAAELAATKPRARAATTDGRRAPAAPPPRSPWLVVGAATVVAVGLVGGTLWWRTQRATEPGKIVIHVPRGTAVLEDAGVPVGAVDAAVVATAEPVDAAVAAPALDAAPAPPRPPRPPSPRTYAEQLTDAFRKQSQAAVNRCATEHDVATAAPDGLQIEFTIDARGVPTKVTILPAAVGATPLGACIAAVGRKTRFPPPADPAMTFRIPVGKRAGT